MIVKVILLLYLGINAWTDWTTRKISLSSFVLCVIVNFLMQFIQNQSVINSQLLGWFPGMILGAVSIVTRGQIGFGDALVIGVTGWMTGWREIIWIWLWAWMGAMIYGGILYVRRKRKKEKIPFIPFVLIGYVIELIVNTWTV